MASKSGIDTVTIIADGKSVTMSADEFSKLPEKIRRTMKNRRTKQMASTATADAPSRAKTKASLKEMLAAFDRIEELEKDIARIKKEIKDETEDLQENLKDRKDRLALINARVRALVKDIRAGQQSLWG